MMVAPLLKRFDITVLKKKTVSDSAQVPAGNVPIRFYRQGATVKTGVTVPDSSTNPDPTPTNVTVYHTGNLGVGDVVQVDTDAAKWLSVGTVDDVNGVVGLVNITGVAIALGVGVRLVKTNNQPFIYLDPKGESSLGTSLNTNASSGRASGYVREYRYDYIITVSGTDVRLFVDAEGSFVIR